MNHLKKISFLGSLAIYCVNVLSAQTDSLLNARLGSIADTATVEHVVCINRNFEMLEVSVIADGHSVVAKACAEMMPEASAVWHNHIAEAGSNPESFCYFTLTDQNTFLRYEIAPVAVVQVNSRVKCWWSRIQVHDGWLEHLVPMPAIPEQETR